MIPESTVDYKQYKEDLLNEIKRKKNHLQKSEYVERQDFLRL